MYGMGLNLPDLCRLLSGEEDVYEDRVRANFWHLHGNGLIQLDDDYRIVSVDYERIFI
jgi:hypothetical protein